MSRSTSETFRIATNSQETGQVLVLLLTLEHENLEDPIRFSTDNADSFEFLGETVRGTISNGENYLYFPMEVQLPEDKEGTVSRASITVCNVLADLLAEIRGMEESPTVTMQVVLASSPNTVEALFSGFEFVDISADAFTITGTLSLGNFLSEPYPGGIILPSNFPGCF